MKSIGLTVLAVVLVAALSFGAWEFKVHTADFFGRGNQIAKTRGDVNYRIASYDHFYDLCASVQALEDQLRAMEHDHALPADQKAANVLALTNQRNTLIRQYNADARKADTSGHFRSSDLPYQIDPILKETMCTA